MELGKRVTLRTFNGTLRAPENCDPSENYWLLIDRTGVVVEAENPRGRVLVKFDVKVMDFGINRTATIVLHHFSGFVN